MRGWLSSVVHMTWAERKWVLCPSTWEKNGRHHPFPGASFSLEPWGHLTLQREEKVLNSVASDLFIQPICSRCFSLRCSVRTAAAPKADALQPPVPEGKQLGQGPRAVSSPSSGPVVTGKLLCIRARGFASLTVLL